MTWDGIKESGTVLTWAEDMGRGERSRDERWRHGMCMERVRTWVIAWVGVAGMGWEK